MTLQVIGAGVGRTGTYSLKLALEQLGFGPCYHMEEVLKDPGQSIPLWNAALAGKPDWETLFEGYNAAVDWPTAAFWHELAAAYPDAKVVLTTRAAERWCQSYSETIFKFLSEAHKAPPQVRPWFDMAIGVIGKSGFARQDDPRRHHRGLRRPGRRREDLAAARASSGVRGQGRLGAALPVSRPAGPRHAVPEDQ